MAPCFLLTEQTIRQDGSGPVLDLRDSSQQTLFLSLGITRVLEQQSLDLTIWGSADGETWGSKPIAAFPQKFYCGAYSLLLDLSAHPDVKYLRATWKVSRWGRGEPTPLFSIYVFAEPAASRVPERAAVA
jgi:hypothetical protein